MTTTTASLTDWLLARIAADEAAAHNWLRFEVRDGIPGNYAIPARVLAECEAKRAILRAAEYAAEVEGGGADIIMSGGYPRDGISGVLAALAAVYSDHADFQEAWRA